MSVAFLDDPRYAVGLALWEGISTVAARHVVFGLFMVGGVEDCGGGVGFDEAADVEEGRDVGEAGGVAPVVGDGTDLAASWRFAGRALARS